MTDFAAILIEHGFVETEERNHQNERVYSYRNSTGAEILQVEVSTVIATAVYMECEFSWSKKLGKGNFDEWLKNEIADATTAHEHAHNALMFIAEQYDDNPIYRFRLVPSFNLPEMRIGFVQDGEFVVLQKYSANVLENELYVVSRMRGSSVRTTIDITVGIDAMHALRDWLSKPHTRYKSAEHAPILRVMDGVTYHVYRTNDAAKYLPLYRDAKSVKIIRANLLLGFDVDEFDLFKELDLKPELYEFIAYESKVVI